MQFISLSFLIFLPAAAFVSYLLPAKARRIFLLLISWFFYMTWGSAYLAVLLFSTLSTWYAGKALTKAKNAAGTDRRGKQILVLCLVCNIGLLFVFKYLNFVLASLTAIVQSGSGADGMLLHLAAPIGISFYILQACGYLIDCYKGRIKAEQDFIVYALFVSFFPQIVSGPIERAERMLPQFRELPAFRTENLRNGFYTMLWGYFLKMVLADRIAVLVDTVYAKPSAYRGTLVVLAVLLYAIQIYCDFCGYSCIAVGTGQILGFKLISNFDSPYLSGSIAEFWRRWHISLSTWFRDYVYIPLGGNRKGTVRKYINVLIVFAVSGLWHGAEWSFILWGLLHGLYQVAGRVLQPLRDRTVMLLRVDRKSFSHRLYKIVVTFILTAFAWIFFRADDTMQAFRVIRCMKGFQPWKLFDGSLEAMGLDILNLYLLGIGLIILLAADICGKLRIDLKQKLAAQGIWLRWGICILAVLIILTCGIWGPGYDSTTFIYSQF